MSWHAGSEGAGTPPPRGHGFVARSRKRRKPSSGRSPGISGIPSEAPGLLAVDKPAGMTSHDVVARVRRVLGGAKVGHAGTLDPEATGVLVLCLGRATKLSAFLMECEKLYAGVGRLGIATDTQDATGRVIAERPVTCSETDLRTAAARFVGRLQQVPPMYSAVKVEGRKLYQLARRGLEVERAARPVTVHAFEVTSVAFPDFEFHLRCSKGTYVRTIIHDLGEALGCGGHLLRLSREAQGSFRREQALAFGALDGPDGAAAIRAAMVLPADGFGHLGAADVSDVPALPLQVGAVLGGAAAAGAGEEGELLRLTIGERLLGLGRRTPEGIRVLHAWSDGARFGRAGRPS